MTTTPPAAGDPATTRAAVLPGREDVRAPADDTLVERLRRGDEQAMAEVFATSLDRVYNYCYRRTGSWTAAEDLTSAVFLEVWRHRRRAVEVDGTVLPWLYGVATNVCRNHARSLRRRDRADARLQLLDVPSAAGADERAAERLDAHRNLRAVLRRVGELPPGDQDVFFLVCWEELTYTRAAEALGIPVGTVRSRLARVRRALRLSAEKELDA